MKLGDGVGRGWSPDVATYTYAGISYATPDANGEIGDELFATTCTYTNDHGVPLVVIRLATTNVVQTLDYYPYGGTRISSNTSGGATQRQYIGQFSDQSNLSYLNARYYDGSRGQFLSQDPVFLGNPKDQHLENPQSLNSYSYANDNPITNKDPNGTQIAPPPPVAFVNPIVAALYVALLALLIITNLAASGNYHVNMPTGSPAPMVQPMPLQNTTHGKSTRIDDFRTGAGLLCLLLGLTVESASRTNNGGLVLEMSTGIRLQVGIHTSMYESVVLHIGKEAVVG
jgi:RHS repeat-associated protein